MVHAQLAVALRNSARPNQLAIEHHFLVWNYDGSQSAGANKGGNHVCFRSRLAAREWNGPPRVDQRLSLARFNLERGRESGDDALIDPPREWLEHGIVSELGWIDVSLRRGRLDGDKRELLTAVDAVSARSRRSSPATRAVGHVLIQGFLTSGAIASKGVAVPRIVNRK